MNTAFDFVIVGAGSAGCCLARRLSESGEYSVCLLEAGPADNDWRIQTPAALVSLMKSPKYNWLYSSTPQRALGGRQLKIPRGKTLGGSSAINSMVYIRGRPSDYDRWAELGCDGWHWRSVLPYFKRSERNLRLGGELHGDAGPMIVSDLPSPHPLCRRWIEAGETTGIGHCRDFNGESQEGLGIYQVTMNAGRRCSSADAYLNIRDRRSNLTVLTGAEVLRIGFDRSRATSVLVRRDGTTSTIRVLGELVLAAGAIGSPSLLISSGIGPRDNLDPLGVEPIRVLEAVGRNLQEHPSIGISMLSASGRGLSLATIPTIAWAPVHYLTQRAGLLTTNHVEAGGFARTNNALTEPDVQFHMIPARVGVDSKGVVWGRGYWADVCLLKPRSRGRIRVERIAHRLQPAIDYKLLENRDDRRRIVDAFLVLRAILQSEPLQRDHPIEESPGPAARTREEILEHCRRRLDTAYHPVGTCRMGPASDPDSVVDPELRVIGLDNVRVADASIMPEIVAGNTNAPAIMIAERASDLILGRNLQQTGTTARGKAAVDK